MDQQKPNGAEILLGMRLNDRWTVKESVSFDNTTGGYFSFGYIVEDDEGIVGFLKALDLSGAYKADDFAQELNRLTAAYLHERDLLQECKDVRMTRVVRAIDQGEIEVADASPSRVPFLVFELAEGDIRALMNVLEGINLPWTLRCLHHVTTELAQLHAQGIGHQDAKPSNVLTFLDGREAKVADLGKSTKKGRPSENDQFIIPGDRTYCPPELLYGQIAEDYPTRRYASDIYQLGNLAVFMFTGSNVTSSLLAKLHYVEHPHIWQGQYSEILPRILYYFDEILSELGPEFPESCRGEMISIVSQLCHPDPMRRGHPKSLGQRANPYSLERYVSIFNRLASRAEIGILT